MTPSHRIEVHHERGTYDVIVGQDILGRVGELAQNIPVSTPVGIITNATVNELYGDQLRKSLQNAGYATRTILVPDGEKFKTLASAEQVLTALIQQGMERSGTIITLGGGVVTDLGGFVASILFRGVRLIHVPTTLLSMVDAAVGGKTGVNHTLGKNLIGSFYQPDLVLMDVATLQTLEPRDIVSGFAEMVKMALILDPAYWDWLIEHTHHLLDKPVDEIMISALSRSIELKVEVVIQDEKESDLRRILNFGHTLGHAIENTLGYGEIRHGEAVILGMYGAGWLSNQLGQLPMADWTIIADKLRSIPLELDLDQLDSTAIERATRRDKKVADSKLNFVLLDAVGKTRIQGGIPSLMIRLAVDAIRKAWKEA